MQDQLNLSGASLKTKTLFCGSRCVLEWNEARGCRLMVISASALLSTGSMLSFSVGWLHCWSCCVQDLPGWFQWNLEKTASGTAWSWRRKGRRERPCPNTLEETKPKQLRYQLWVVAAALMGPSPWTVDFFTPLNVNRSYLTVASWIATELGLSISWAISIPDKSSPSASRQAMHN